MALHVPPLILGLVGVGAAGVAGVAVLASSGPLAPDSAPPEVGTAFQIRTLAGVPQPPRTDPNLKDGEARLAHFNGATDLAQAADGTIYVADFDNYAIRKIGPDGTVSTLAGNGTPGVEDGDGNDARFLGPTFLTIGPDGNLYVSDSPAHRIRVVTPEGRVSTLVGSGPTGLAVGESVDGPVSTARLDRPAGLVFLHDGSLLFAESSNRIRGISPEGEVFTWLGDGSHSSEDGPLGVATVWYPVALALAPDGTVYFTEHGTGSVRRVRDGQVETLAGRTTGIEGSADQLPGLDFPSGLAVRPDGAILVADTSRHRLLVLESDGILRLLAGGVTPGHRDGSGWDSLFNLPTNVLVSPGGNILVADSGNSVIREIVWD